MCENVVKKLLFVIKYVPDCFKTKQSYYKNPGMLLFIADCYKDQKMCDGAVNNDFHVLEFVPEYCQTQKMCDKAVNNNSSTIQLVSER